MALALLAAGCGSGSDGFSEPVITQLPDVTTTLWVSVDDRASSASAVSDESLTGSAEIRESEADDGDTDAVGDEGAVSNAAAVEPAVTLPATTIPDTTTTTSSTTTTSTTTTSTSTSTTSTITTTEPAVTAVVVAAPTPGAQTTACTSVAVIGDSTAVGLDGSTGAISSEVGIVSKLGAIGVADVRLDISGGRSIVETLPGQINGTDAIAALRAGGFDGCWIVALGTNDAANISAGSNADAANRVDRIINATGGGRLLWINASTITTSGHWARNNTVQWNNDLAALLAGRGNVGLADWDSLASQNAWFVSDGIHPNSAGLTARAQFFADSLRAFFPA